MSLWKAGRNDQALAALSDAIGLNPGYAEAYNCRGIVLVSIGRPHDALLSFNRALELKPEYAECHNNLGIVLQDLGRLDEALVSFDKATGLKPDNARAHNNRGTTLGELRRSGDALISYDRAIALAPTYAEAFYNRGLALHDLRRFDEALASFDRAILLRADYAEAHHNRGALLQDMQRVADAVDAYGAAIRLRPDRIESRVNQSYCYLQTGRFAEGWMLHEWRRQLPGTLAGRTFPQPSWLGREDVTNKTLFVYWEQGFGDTIQFCRYARALKDRGANIIMSVQDPLYRLLAPMSPRIKVIHQADVPARFDYHCPMVSLPLAFGTLLQTIPSEPSYISSDDRLRQNWEERLPAKSKARIGIAWKGSAAHRNDRYRSIDIDLLAPLFSTDAHWVSLQHDGRHPTSPSPSLLASHDGHWEDFADTAALIDCLDLVVTVDTSVAHLAGALGKPVFVLLPFNSDWRWLLHRDDSPWYPSARLFRQSQTEPWQDVILRVGAAVSEFIRSYS